MITINDYTSARLELCVDCAEWLTTTGRLNPNQFVGLRSDLDTGELLEPHFGKSPCDLCGSELAGDRYPATLLTKTTTVRGN
jgi:hypothetical protein